MQVKEDNTAQQSDEITVVLNMKTEKKTRQAEYSKRYYEKNKATLNSKRCEQYQQNKEQELLAAKERYEINKEKRREYQRRYREAQKKFKIEFFNNDLTRYHDTLKDALKTVCV